MMISASKLLVLALLGQWYAAISGELEIAGSGKKLNILMLSDFAIGHLTNLLRVGEELSLCGHNVTMLVIPNKADQTKYKHMVEEVGVQFWNVTSEGLPQVDMKRLSENVSTAHMAAMLETVRPYMATLNKILAKHVNRSLSAGDWDIVMGNDFMQLFLSCMHASHTVPMVIIGAAFQFATHSKPQWPWPGLMHGASSDNLGFIGRATSDVFNFAFATVLKEIFTDSLTAISEYCPSVSMQQATSNIAVNIPYVVPTAMGLEYPRTVSSMTHYVGPLVPRSPPPLTRELGEWLSSKPVKSVVYISMGSMFSLDRDGGQTFLEGVMSTNYSVLWSLRKSACVS